MHVSLTYLRLISANAAVFFFFAVNLQIYLETIIIAKNKALASARYKNLCHWRSSELIVVKRANDDL